MLLGTRKANCGNQKNQNHSKNDILLICSLLQRKNVKFAIAGARACGFHGYVRATEDIDILIQNEKENIEKTIQCIEELYPSLEKITVQDFLENIVIKILET